MATITFWEKPGCEGNARQRSILEQAGHTVVVKNLLAEPWTRLRLLGFLEPLPIAHWFNRSAPEVRDGELIPEEFDGITALGLLVNNPLLIRRPLMEAADGSRHVGFVLEDVDAWVGLGDAWPKDAPRPAVEGCVHGNAAHAMCPAPE